jgi:hypothetical protein
MSDGSVSLTQLMDLANSQAATIARQGASITRLCAEYNELLDIREGLEARVRELETENARLTKVVRGWTGADDADAAYAARLRAAYASVGLIEEVSNGRG